MKHKLLLLAVLAVAPILSALQSPDFSGVWIASDVGFAPWTFNLKATGNSLSGTATQGSLDAASSMSTTLVGPFEIYDGKSEGNQISFKLKTPDGGRIITFNGTRTGDKIAFSRSVQVVSGVPGQNGILGAAGATSLTASLNGNPGSAAAVPAGIPANAPAARPAPPTGPADTWQATLVPGAPWTFELAVSGETLTGNVQQNVPGSPPAVITSGKVEGTAQAFPTGEAVNAALRGMLDTARAVRTHGGLPNTALQPASRARRKSKLTRNPRAARGRTPSTS